MEVKKKALFRIQIKDLRSNKSRVITVYSNGENPTLDQFKQMLVGLIKNKK